MSDGPDLIKRYPNRRYYAHNMSKYVSLQEIEEIVKGGRTVEIRDSQTGADLTRVVLTQIIMERHPEKMLLFPTDLLHFILRSNDVMSDFLHDYLAHSLTYLDYLRHHGAAATALVRPMHWLKAWLDEVSPNSISDATENEPDHLSKRVKQLEERLQQLESQNR